ncbi:MAG: hypothetical protein HZB53_05690 [Chloroflexi bacterium]|nr:hypothetical protein [Chloroflexota bacterium]
MPTVTVTPRAAMPVATPPARPARFDGFPGAILDYLNMYGADSSALLALLRSWGALHWEIPKPNLTEARNVVVDDLDGDGRAEIVVAIVSPEDCCLSMLLIYARSGATYRLAQQVGAANRSGSDVAIQSLHILAVRDLTGDDRPELVYTPWFCGAHTCGADVNIVRWDGERLVSLLTQPANMAEPEIRFVESGHGTVDLVMYGGLINSAGAGTMRARTDVYRWNGDKFTLFATTVDASNLLYFKVVDANTEFAAGRYAAAIDLYWEVIQNPRLKTSGDWRGVPTERDDLLAFARFRVGVAYLLTGDRPRAQAAHDELPRRQPDHVYAEVVRRFWAAYPTQASIAAGCAAVTDFARTDQRVADVLKGFGYGNPNIRAEDVCPIR